MSLSVSLSVTQASSAMSRPLGSVPSFVPGGKSSAGPSWHGLARCGGWHGPARCGVPTARAKVAAWAKIAELSVAIVAVAARPVGSAAARVEDAKAAA
eukprot:scaffold89078_cov63-Phaeocystis_antarctica.AAC.1